MLDARLVSELVGLLLLAGAALPAVVLPRPPSLPNYIPVDYVAPMFEPPKSYANKGLFQRTNVEKPETQQDYRLLEIELRDGENVENLDLHRIVQEVLDKQRQPLLPNARRFDEADYNLTYVHPEIVPRSVVGVREVGLRREKDPLYEPRKLEGNEPGPQYSGGPVQPEKDLGDEKLYYLKNGRPKVYVSFRGNSGHFKQRDTATGADSRFTLRLEPSTLLRATQPYHMERKAKSPKSPPKKYNALVHGSASGGSTSENPMVTSSELPKQIPAPPSRMPPPSPVVHTTPVQRYTARRTDILPGDSFPEA